MPPAGYPAFLQYLQSGRVSNCIRSFWLNRGTVSLIMQTFNWLPA